MNRKFEYIVVAATMVGTIVAFLAWQFPVQPEQPRVEIVGSVQPLRDKIGDENVHHRRNADQTAVEIPRQDKQIANESKRNGAEQEWVKRGSPTTFNATKEVYTPAELVISSTGAHIQIKKGHSGRPYGGGSISGTGSHSIAYLPAGQSLHIKVSGTGVTLNIEKTILEYVTVFDRGTGTQISEI